MKRLIKRLAVMVGVVTLGLFVSAPDTYAQLNTRARETFATMFDASGYVGWPVYAADPFTCDSTHLPSSSRPAVNYWNSAESVIRVCDGTAWRDVASVGSAGVITTTEILDATIANADISATAAIARSKLAEDALQPYPVVLHSLRAADMAALGVSETAGDHYIVVSTNDIIVRGEISDDETEASVSYFQFALPPEYVAAGDVTVTVNSKTAVVGAGGNTNGSTIDFEVYEINQTTGAAGSDICATAAQAIDGTAAADTFTITATGLVAGDILNVRMTTSVIENDGSTGTIQAEVYSIVVKADIKG